MTHTKIYAPKLVVGLIAGTIWLTAVPVTAQQQATEATSAAAQQQPSSGDQQTPAQKTAPSAPESKTSQPEAATAAEKKDQAIQQKTGTSRDRMFFALPNFLVVNSDDIPQLSAAQKFKVVASGAFDPVEFGWYGLLSGISQAENSEPAYGQGLEGYGKRYVTSLADGTVENFMVGAVMPSLLHQDPRYYQLGKGGFWHRTGYALSRLLVTRSDSGRSEFNFSEIGGSAISASISTFGYHPQGERYIGNAGTVWGTQVGEDGITFMLREFWPDMRRKFLRKKTAVAGAGTHPSGTGDSVSPVPDTLK